MTRARTWRQSLAILALTGAVCAAVMWLNSVVSWRFPGLLWGLLLVPLVLAAAWIGEFIDHHRDRRFGTPSAVRQLVAGRCPRLRRVHLGLSLGGLACAILAFAGPQYGSRTQTVKKRGVDIVVALDFSKSMLAQDVKPNRITRAKGELARFFDELAGDRIGVVAFAGDTIEFPMTTDYSAIDLFLHDLGPNDMPVGGTAIARALVAAQRLLDRVQLGTTAEQTENPALAARSRVVILLTDGEDHEGDPEGAAESLKDAGIRLYTVGIGSSSGEPIPTYAADGTWTGYLRDEDGKPVTSALTEENEAVLTTIADATGGKFFRAERGGVGMNQIRQEIRRMKQRDLEEQRVTIMEDRYALVLLPAFLLLLLQAFLPVGRQRAKATGVAVAAVFFVPTLVTSPASAWDLFRKENRQVATGNRAYGEEDYAGAEEAYGRAAQQLPNEPAVHINRGLAQLRQGEFDNAQESFLQSIGPDSPRELRAEAYYNLGVGTFRRGAEAAEQASAASATEDSADPSVAAATWRSAQSAFEEAAEAFRNSLRQRPGNRDAAWNYELARREAARAAEHAREAEEQAREQQEEEAQQENESASDDPGGEGNQQEQPEQPDDGTENEDGSESDDPDANGDQQSDDEEESESGNNTSEDESEPQENGSEQTSERPEEGQRDTDGEAGNEGTPANHRDQQGGSESSSAQRQATERGDLAADRPDVARVLDALRAGEKSLPMQRAQRRGGRQRTTMDW